MKNKTIIYLFAICMASAAIAQENIIPWQRSSHMTTGIHFQYFQLEEDNAITQVSFPTSVMFPIGDKVSCKITNSPAWTKWDVYGQKNTLSGISDTWFQMSALLKNKKLLVHGGVGVPTGKTKLNDQEFATALTMSQNFVKLSLPTYGQGLCAQVGAIYSKPVKDNVIMGAGIQYLYRHQYRPLSQTFQLVNGDTKLLEPEFDPGDEISLHLGMDMLLSDYVKFMLDGSYSHYQRDMMDGVEVYGSGGRIKLDTGVYYQFEEQYLWALISYRYKGKNEFLRSLGFVTEEKNSNGYEVEMNVLYDPYSFDSGSLFLLMDNRFYGPGVYTGEGIQLYGAGMGMDMMWGRGNNKMDFQFKFFFGQRHEGGATIAMRGFEVLTNLNFDL